MKQNNKIVLFQSRKIRRIWHEKEWWFSVVDIVSALSESPSPRTYWEKIKKREFIDNQLSPIWGQLKLESVDGKFYSTDCVNTKNAFRLIQSIPSPKAEPFKMWLAQVGQERLEEDDKDGGKVAGRTRRDIESRSGKKVVTKQNYKLLK